MNAARRLDPAWNNNTEGRQPTAADVVNAASSKLFTIETEATADVYQREALLDRAMGPRRKRKSSEKLRRGRMPADGLALVARAGDGRLLGTVRLWNVWLGVNGGEVLLLGPLAVEPDMKGIGIGSALMNEAIAKAAQLQHRAILLVGDPEYYVRFGFTADRTGQLSMSGPYEKHRFLALELQDGALNNASGVLQACGRLIPKGMPQRLQTMKRQKALA